MLGAVISAHHDPREAGAPLTRTVLQADAIVALLEGHRAVNTLQLEALGLEPNVAIRIAAMLPSVPGFLNALDTEPAKLAPSAPSSKPAATRPQDWLCVAPVSALTGAPWLVKHVDTVSLRATSPQPLQAGLLVELAMTPTDLRFWALVDSSEPVGDVFEVGFKPFALTADQARRWDEVVEAQPAAA